MKNRLKLIIAIAITISTLGDSWAQTTFSITVPEGASVFVGAPEYQGYNYRPFTGKTAVSTSTNGGKATYNYNVSGKHNYRVSQAGKLTQAGVFTPNASNKTLEITSGQLTSHNPKEIDRDVNSNNGYNVADIFLNINEKGHLKLSQGDTYQLVNLRTWSMVDHIVTNYFLEPDYHYTVINENGNVDNSVVTINEKGLVKTVKNGTAIVLVTYDAINVHSAVGGPFFGALWGENTGVFVVSVGGAASSEITSGMVINETKNAGSTDKTAVTAVDAELDVFYYLEETGGFDYSFTPSNVVSVELAQPEITGNELNFNGFSTGNVTKNPDNSYTVRLINGRNIVKMTAASGAVEYQVLTAKSVSYTLSNLTNPGGKINPGDEVSVKFSTLYHPCGKLPGIYNMAAGIQYNDLDAKIVTVGGVAQYAFASKAQVYKTTIPAEFTGNEFVLTNGVIKASGNGNPYGSHREISLEKGVGTEMSASIRTAYFGVLPDISIPLNGNNSIEQVKADVIHVYPNPFTGYIIVNAITEDTATIYDISGSAILSVNLKNGSNRIETSALPKGIYLLKAGENAVKIVK